MVEECNPHFDGDGMGSFGFAKVPCAAAHLYAMEVKLCDQDRAGIRLGEAFTVLRGE